jgi:hypothetical protein
MLFLKHGGFATSSERLFVVIRLLLRYPRTNGIADRLTSRCIVYGGLVNRTHL